MALILAASLPVLFWLQTILPDGGLSLAFRPASLWRGDWWPAIFTSMFIHSGWGHVAMNAVGVLALAPPLAPVFAGAKGGAGFVALYI